MKRFTLFMSMICLLSLSVEARKTWDFAGKGFSAATLELLAADTENWTPNLAENNNRFKNAVQMSGELQVAGQVIPETAELYFGKLGAGKLNIDFGYTPARIMLNGKDLTFTIKGLVAGQQIAIETMTANTSSERGIVCSTNNATRIGGEEISLEPQINIFVVNEDVADSVDVTFKTVNGGIHIRSIIVDNGDEEGGNMESLKIAYLYQSTYTSYVSLEDDVLYQCTKLAEENALAVDVANFTAADTDTLDALAANYDLVVVSEAIDGKSAFGAKIAEYVNRVPMLSFKSFFYNSGRWNWGTGKNPSTAKTEGGVPFLTIVAGAEEHPIFADVEIGDDNTVQMFEEYEGLLSNMVQGYEASAGSLIENDNVLATVTGSAGTFNAIHEHGTKNTYMLIPLSSDAILVEGTENLGWETAIPMINNAINYLAATKSKVTPCVKPAAEYAYDDMVTTVTLTSATPESQIYYTLDGSVPTEASTLYAAPFQVTAPCKLSAIAFRQGYDPSSVLEDSVAVMPKSAAPVISVTDAEGGKLVTITAAEGSAIYYNLISATPTTASKVYTEPFVVSRSCTVSAIAAAEGKLESSAVAKYIEIAAYPLRQKEIEWANFQDAPDVWVWANTDSTTTNNGDIFKAYDYVAVTDTTPEGPTYKEVDFNNGWKVGTYGQRINLQKTGTNETIGADYGPLSPDDAGASGYAMSFLVTKKANDPCTAFLQTTKTYEGPFDINIWACGQTGSTSYIEALEVSVSADGMEWAVIDTFKYESTKKMRRFIAHYDDKAAAYVKIAHVGDPAKSNKYKAMIFDVKLMAEGVAQGIENVATASGELVSESYYNLSGMMIKEPAKGVVIVKKVYANGTMKIEKQLIK